MSFKRSFYSPKAHNFMKKVDFRFKNHLAFNLSFSDLACTTFNDISFMFNYIFQV